MVIGISKYKLNSGAGISLLAVLSLMIAWMAAKYEYAYVPIIAAGIAASFFTVLATFINPFHGLLINLAICFLVYLPQRIMGLTYSLASLWDVHLAICFLAALFSIKGSRVKTENVVFFKNPITVFVIIYFLYVLAEFFNPNVPHKLGWILFMRRAISFMLIYFSAYYILTDFYKIRRFLQLFMIMVAVTTVYGYWQQAFGLPPWDFALVNSSYEVYHLHVQWGLIRKFSFLDVVIFPMIVNMGALMLTIFALYENKQKKSLLFIVAAVIMLVGATFSGTRSASYIFPAGLLLYSVANINKPRTILIYGGLIAILIVLVTAPVYRFNTLNRFRSSFSTNEASLEVRNINRERIQPYIYEHPFGGGLLTTGSYGEKMYPNHPLASFPPDSGLLASALEKGWVGLILDMLLFLMIMIEGTKGYFRTGNEAFKKYYMALTCGIFSLVLGEYAQIVIFQIPVCMFFLPAAAIIIRLRQIDKQNPDTLLIKKK